MARILLIEDNEMNRDMLSRRLGRRGHEVIVATDGRQALDLAQGSAFDLILMDMSIPEIDGWEVTRRLKRAGRENCPPIIGLSAHAMPGDREKGLAAGCDDYDTKPVDFDRLLGKIESQLGRCQG